MVKKNPSFWSPMWAAIRQGSKELAQILPALPNSVRVVEEPGTLGNPTPQMLTDEIEPKRKEEHKDRLRRYSSRGRENGEKERGVERE